ncbi:hypothetical protein V2J09_019499 [Rumex salicifolius]
MRSITGDERSSSRSNEVKKKESSRSPFHRDAIPGMDLWTDGLVCAFEFVRGRRKVYKTKPSPKFQSPLLDGRKADTSIQNGNYNKKSHSPMDLEPDQDSPTDEQLYSHSNQPDQFPESHWVAIGWARIAELVQTIQVDAGWSSQQLDFIGEEEDVTVAELAAPYWERPAGPVWWCHVDASKPHIISWLTNAQWLHPAISIALRDESRLISERMKYLLYEVPVRVAGGLLFELLGQSAGDPLVDEDDIPIVLRSWQAQNFLITVMHMKGSASIINVLGLTEVQELLFAGGYNAPRSTHEVIAHLACRLARWDDRLFRKSIFGAADEVELKFVNRSNHEDLNLFAVILNQEIRKLSRQVIRVKWSLHAREEIMFELLQHLRGNAAKNLVEGIRKSTREMVEEQEAVRGRLFTIQDVMQSNVRAWLQDRSLRVTHNLGVFGGCGLILSIITGLFGINVDGIPGSDNTPYAFGLFAGVLFLVGIILIGLGLLYLGLKQPVSEEQVEVRKLELDELVKMFQHEAETHAQVRQNGSRARPRTAGGHFPLGADYVQSKPLIRDLLCAANGCSSTWISEKLQNHVELSKYRNSFRTFCTYSDLASKKCVPCNSKDLRSMNEEAATDMINKVPGWNLVNEEGKLKLSQTWKVKSFTNGLELFQAVANVAEAEGHHPDLHLAGWNNVTVEIWTHAVGGLTENDFILASKISGLDIAHLLRT